MSTLSILPTYSLRSLYIHVGLRVVSNAGRPYSHHTTSIAAGNLGQSVHLLLLPYSLHKISSVLYPVRSAASIDVKGV